MHEAGIKQQWPLVPRIRASLLLYAELPVTSNLVIRYSGFGLQTLACTAALWHRPIGAR